jgi:5S rRNA maturation endonuclease (ribonuclease M5)
LLDLGFKNIFVINETGKSLYEKIEEIEELAGKRKICILTDFDKKGKKLYLKLKSELSTRKLRLNNSFRGILLKLNISHIEGLSSFIKSQKEKFK